MQIISEWHIVTPVKAGAYAIQGVWGKHVKGIVGDYNNVVGLPIARLYQECKNRGIELY